VLLFDTNVLVYAANRDSPLHLPCRRRLAEARRDPTPAYLTWSVCYEASPRCAIDCPAAR